jgi:Flp pilus assembly CpaF family ATPase
LSTPFVDAMLPDGSLLHVVIPQITRAHLAVNIRKFVLSIATLDELVALNFISALAANFLEVSVAAGLNILVSGGTQEKVRSSIVGTKMPVPRTKTSDGPRSRSSRPAHCRC